ncbi:MAG: DUF3987 domain-containing protein [Bacteroidales bacterium]
MADLNNNFENITENDLLNIPFQINAESAFPFEVFPLKIQEIINETYATLDFPVDYIAASLLSAISIAIGNTFRVQVKKAWDESALLYMALVGKSGINKTHPLSFALNPIQNRDKKSYQDYEVKKQEYDKLQALSAKDRKDQGIEEPQKPVWNKFIVSDFTPEALAQIHKYNKRGICVYIDELAGWFKNFNRYNNGSEMEFWLSAWSARPINIDRKSGEPVFIASPYIPVFGTIQNKVLIDMSKNGRNNNGFIERILFVMPDNLQKPYWSEKELDVKFHNNWYEIINFLLDLQIQYDDCNNPISSILKFDKEAKKQLESWQNSNADLINSEDDEFSSIYSKLEIYVIRLALILEMADFACKREENVQCITENAVSGAIKLIEYFRKTALKVHAIINNENIENKYSQDKIDLFKALPDNFTTKEAITIGAEYKKNEKFIDRFISDEKMFIKTSHGNYAKIKN